MKANGAIVITKTDRKRLQERIWPNGSALNGRGVPWYEAALEQELSRARIVDPKRVPPDVVTMNSTVEVRCGHAEPDVFTIVYPEHADIDAGKISILSPIGLALIGARAGEEVRIETPAGPRRYKVERILFQPEAAKQWEL